MDRVPVGLYFFLDEFVDPHTYFNEKDHGVSLIDSRLFVIADKKRVLLDKPGYINTWWRYYKEKERVLTCKQIIYNIERSSTLRKWSGLRTDRCKIGAKQSAHRPLVDNQCKAIDYVGDEQEQYRLIKDNAEMFYNLGVRRLEDPSITRGWSHIDTLEKNTQPNSIRVVDLEKATEIIKW